MPYQFETIFLSQEEKHNHTASQFSLLCFTKPKWLWKSVYLHNVCWHIPMKHGLPLRACCSWKPPASECGVSRRDDCVINTSHRHCGVSPLVSKTIVKSSWSPLAVAVLKMGKTIQFDSCGATDPNHRALQLLQTLITHLNCQAK